MKLKPCPSCLNLPERLPVQADHDKAKWAYVGCPECDFQTEFRNSWNKIGSAESLELAYLAWNDCYRNPLLVAAPKMLAALEGVLNNHNAGVGRDNEPDWLVVVRDVVDEITDENILTATQQAGASDRTRSS